MAKEEKYTLESPAGKEEKYYSWRAAIGIQGVDRLAPSEYLIEVANQNINDQISVDQAIDLIGQYYVARNQRETTIEGTEEADKAAANIAKLLQEKAFSFSPIGLISIHKRIFYGVFPHAGQIRPYNITKSEWVLNGETVTYTPFSELMPTLEYEINKEKGFSYAGLTDDQKISHIVAFIKDLWQIHPFQEGNTRTTIVFLIKMLRQLEFQVDNKLFAENAWFFRNALVRANYRTASIDVDQQPLIRFFENLLLGKSHELKNRDLRLPVSSEKDAKSETLPNMDDPSRQTEDKPNSAITPENVLKCAYASSCFLPKIPDASELPEISERLLKEGFPKLDKTLREEIAEDKYRRRSSPINEQTELQMKPRD